MQRHRAVARGLGALLLVVPAYFVGQYYQTSTFADQIKKDWPVVAQALDHHVLLGVTLAGLWGYLLLGVYRALAILAQEEPNGWESAPAILLRALDNIVGAKEQRFSQYLNSIRDPKPNPGEVFSFITQPDRQLNEVIQGVYSTVDSLLRSQQISRYGLKVNLAALDEQQNVRGIHFHYPSNHPVRSSPEELNNPNSGIKAAIRTKKIVVVENIRAESEKAKPRFVVTDPSRKDEEGSLICYPVYYEPMRAVVFVISLHVDQPGAFKEKFAASYAELLKPFALRIKLEYALLALKELTKNGQANQGPVDGAHNPAPSI